MNEKKYVIILNKQGVWEDRTDEITDCIFNPEIARYQVTFKANPDKLFPYSRSRIRQLNELITSHNPDEVQIRVSKSVLSGVDEILKYADFYLITRNGKRKPISVKEVSIERNIAIDLESKSALSYFRAMAEVVSVQNDEDVSHLTKQFDHLSKISDASVLAAYLSPESELKKNRSA